MQSEPMTYGGHARAVTRLGLPLIGGHLGQVAIGVTDTVMLGWYGIDELAAATLAGSYFFLLFLLGSGFAWAVMPMVATFAAEGDERSVRRATRMGMWCSLIYAVLVMPLLWWSLPVFLLLGQDPVTAELAADYLRIAGWGIFPALLVMTLKSYLAALERTQVVFWCMMVGALANGLANYALIFGHWGAPELGIAGSAIASVLTQCVMLVGVGLYVVWALPEHTLFQRVWRPDWDMLARVFRLGTPIGLTTLSEAGLFSATAIMMGWLGTVALAAHGIALNLASVTFMAHLGLSNVATIRVGNALGRRDGLHLIRGAQTVTWMSVAFALITVVLFLAMPEQLVALFMSPDTEAREAVLAAGVVLLACAALFQLVDGAQVVALGLLRGMQDTSMPMVYAAISYWGLGFPASYLLGFVFGFGGPGVWIGLTVGLAMACVLLTWRFWCVSIRANAPAAIKATEPRPNDAI